MGHLPLISAGLRLQRNVKYKYDSICSLLLTSLVSSVMHYCHIYGYTVKMLLFQKKKDAEGIGRQKNELESEPLVKNKEKISYKMMIKYVDVVFHIVHGVSNCSFHTHP